MKETITQKLIALDLDGQDKEDVIQQLANLLDEDGRLNNREAYIRNVQERERLTTTGIGFGIAIPHGKTDAVKDVSVAIGRLQTPVEWDAMDGKPVTMVFQIAVPEASKGNEHLRLISALSRQLIHQEFRDQIMNATSSQEVLDLLGNSLEKTPA